MPSQPFRQFFTDYRALLPYALLGIAAGVCSALVIMLFDYLINLLGSSWMGDQTPDGFEALPRWMHFALPLGGAFALGLGFSALRSDDRDIGIVHVLSRMHSHYGYLPLRNAAVQLVGGAIALATGQSGGKEGPGVHLGAAINSLLAYRLNLPNNSQRILIACGTAASIAVAFDTPLAGIIFAMEVIVTEYTVVGFTPVILAAVSATTLNHAFRNYGVIFAIPAVELTSLWELPFILLLGILAGATVALFIYLLKRTLRFSKLPVVVRFTLAGLITGTLALLMPEVLGMGYDTLARVLFTEVAPTLLLLLIACKIVATACSVGLGLPVGLIGPSLLIGACLGGALGGWGAALAPELSSNPVLYVVIGMGAAMAAVLNAPLAAILAVVELTHTVSAVFPSMLAIVAATLTNTIVFKQRSAHQTVLAHLSREIPEDPISLLLHQTNAVAAMEVGLRRIPAAPEEDTLLSLQNNAPNWCLLERDGETLYLVQGAELQQRLSERETGAICLLTELDLRRWSVTSINERATLREALDTLRRETAEAVLVTTRNTKQVLGVLTRDTIDQFYLRRL
jgi:CIC family chloride channel protein